MGDVQFVLTKRKMFPWLRKMVLYFVVFIYGAWPSPLCYVVVAECILLLQQDMAMVETFLPNIRGAK